MDNDDINQGVFYDDWYCSGNLYDNNDNNGYNNSFGID